jgi:hypothetical protein
VKTNILLLPAAPAGATAPSVFPVVSGATPPISRLILFCSSAVARQNLASYRMA